MKFLINLIFFIAFTTLYGKSPNIFSNEPDCIITSSEIQSTKNKSLKVLLIGSSFGIDAIQHFPILAHKAGVDIICGILYSSGIKLNQIVAKNYANENFEIYGISDGTKWVRQSGERTISRALADYEWDIIILQRSAHSSHTWTEVQRSSLYQIMDVIRKTTAYEPEIMFNSCNSFPISISRSFTREDQLSKTHQINISTRKMQQDTGLDFIPNNIAVQNARNTFLRMYGTSPDKDLSRDGLHLDSGIGNYVTGCTMFEKLLGERFGLSISNLSYIPTLDDIKGLLGSKKTFTPISEEMAKVAKEAAILAVKTPFNISEELINRYP